MEVWSRRPPGPTFDRLLARGTVERRGGEAVPEARRWTSEVRDYLHGPRVCRTRAANWRTTTVQSVGALRSQTPRAVDDEIIKKRYDIGLYLVSFVKDKNTLQGSVGSGRNEVQAIPTKTISDRTEEILALCKTLSTYVNKVFSAVLRLEYELVNTGGNL